MRIKFRLILLLQTSFLFFIWNCTGLNVGAKMGAGAVTNPSPDYANPVYLGDKRGILYHNNTTAGQISDTAESKVTGESCSKSILWLIAWGDSSIETSKKAAGITKVASVEYEQTGILGFLYHSVCTRVTGSKDTVASEPAKTIEAANPVKAPAKKGK